MSHFCVNCGAPLVARVIEGRELEACPHDDFVLWRDPKVAVAVVVEHAGGIVVGRRAIEPGYGSLCLPGGFVNDGEDPLEAAIRECREEIGVSVEAIRLLGVYNVRKTAASSIVGIAYSARVSAGEEISPGSEMLEVRVFPRDSVPPLAFSSHQWIVGEYLKSQEQQAEPAPQNVAAGARPAKQPSQPPAGRRPPRTR